MYLKILMDKTLFSYSCMHVKGENLNIWTLSTFVLTNMLVLSGTELIFFLVASMGLCFGFVLKTVFIIQGCFSYCWAVLTQSQGLFCSSPHPTSEEAGGAQEVGRGHSRDSWPQLTKGIFHTVWRHAQHIKLGEEEGRRVHSEWWHLFSQVTVKRDGALLPRRRLNTCLPMGNSEWIPCSNSLSRYSYTN